VFRDESRLVADKARSRSKRSTRSLPIEPSTHGLTVNTSAIHSAVPRAITIESDSLAVDFFLNNFVGIDNLFSAPCEAELVLDDTLVDAVTKAVAYMTWTSLVPEPHHHRKAQEFYGAALLKLANIWQSEDGLANDTTLHAVLLLSFFELSASFDTFHKSWLAHIGGLSGLLQLRWQRGIKTPFGIRVIMQTQSQLAHNALQTGTAISEEMTSRAQLVLKSVPPAKRPAEEVNQLMMRLTQLQARSRVSGMSRNLLEDLGSLDRDLQLWSRRLPSPWSFSAQELPCDTEHWWDKRHDIYSTQLMAYIWNRARAARLIIYDIILTYCANAGMQSKDGHSFNRTEEAIASRECITNICASIPLFYRCPTVGLQRDHERCPPIGNAYWLIWPLEVVGSVMIAPSELKSWIVDCIERIHQYTGIAKAQEVAERLRAGRGRFLTDFEKCR
jgi:hypothetical protein